MISESHGVIQGIRLHRLTPHRDGRGVFLELFKQSWSLPIQPAQWSLVSSTARTLRGFYLHRRHDELFLLVQGRAEVALMDLRRSSPTFGRTVILPMEAAEPTVLTFPASILHAWYFSEPSLHLQAVSEEYDTYRDDDNLRCHWADPDVGISWRDPEPIVSPEAAAAGSLQALLGRIGRLGYL